MSAQDNRRVGRALVCGALLVYGCLRIPAAAQPAAAPQAQELQKLRQYVRHLEAPQPQIPGKSGGESVSPGFGGERNDCQSEEKSQRGIRYRHSQRAVLLNRPPEQKVDARADQAPD